MYREIEYQYYKEVGKWVAAGSLFLTTLSIVIAIIAPQTVDTGLSLAKFVLRGFILGVALGAFRFVKVPKELLRGEELMFIFLIAVFIYAAIVSFLSYVTSFTIW